MRKFFLLLIAGIVALIAAQMVLALFVGILNIPVVKTMPRILSAIILLGGIGLAVFSGILCFRKLLSHLKKNSINRGFSP